MSSLGFPRRWKTPEFIENNGGWVVFTIFIGLPAILVISGESDRIFEWFLSLFSIHTTGALPTDAKIHTHWAIKYALLFILCVFVPVSIYLLYIRLHPKHLQRKAETAYDIVTKEVSRIYGQMYGVHTPSRHNLEKVHLVYHVDRKYSVRCDARIGFVAKHDMHCWKYQVGAEPEGEGQEFISDIAFSVEAKGRVLAFLPLKDATHKKEIVIFFLPYVKQGEKCEMDVSWTWPRCMGQLRVRKKEELGWTCESVDENCAGDLQIECVFDKKLGDIQCNNVGINPVGAQLQKSEKPNETIW